MTFASTTKVFFSLFKETKIPPLYFLHLILQKSIKKSIHRSKIKIDISLSSLKPRLHLFVLLILIIIL